MTKPDGTLIRAEVYLFGELAGGTGGCAGSKRSPGSSTPTPAAPISPALADAPRSGQPVSLRATAIRSPPTQRSAMARRQERRPQRGKPAASTGHGVASAAGQALQEVTGKPGSRRFPVTLTHLLVTRCQIRHHTIACQPGKASDALTGHYRHAHPATPSLPPPGSQPHRSPTDRKDRCPAGASRPGRTTPPTPAVTSRSQPTKRARPLSAPARRGAFLRRSTGLCTPGRPAAPDHLQALPETSGSARLRYVPGPPASGGGAQLRPAACRLAVSSALPLLRQEPDRRGPEAMQEIKQLSRRAEMVAAGPATLAGGSDPLADPVVTAMQSVLSGEPSGNLGCAA